MKLSDSQLTKISEYLLDISKLLVGSIFVPIFIPGSSFGAFSLWLFVTGMVASLLFVFIALKILPSSKI